MCVYLCVLYLKGCMLFIHCSCAVISEVGSCVYIVVYCVKGCMLLSSVVFVVVNYCVLWTVAVSNEWIYVRLIVRYNCGFED